MSNFENLIFCPDFNFFKVCIFATNSMHFLYLSVMCIGILQISINHMVLYGFWSISCCGPHVDSQNFKRTHTVNAQPRELKYLEEYFVVNWNQSGAWPPHFGKKVYF